MIWLSKSNRIYHLLLYHPFIVCLSLFLFNDDQHYILYIFYSIILTFNFTLAFQYHDQERGHSSSRYGSSSRRALVSSTRPSSSGDHTDSRTGRVTSSASRPSTAHRTQPTYETKQASFTRSGSIRGNRDDPLRSFELLSIRK